MSADSSPISVRSFAPHPRQKRPYKPPLRPHSPLPKTLANRCQAARARSHRAATVNREHCRFAVSSDLLLIPVLHLLFFLSLGISLTPCLSRSCSRMTRPTLTRSYRRQMETPARDCRSSGTPRPRNPRHQTRLDFMNAVVSMLAPRSLCTRRSPPRSRHHRQNTNLWPHLLASTGSFQDPQPRHRPHRDLLDIVVQTIVTKSHRKRLAVDITTARDSSSTSSR
jgi:hypothetical protein